MYDSISNRITNDRRLTKKTSNFVSTKPPWWFEFRRIRYKRNKLTLQMILRQSFIETLKDYLENTSLGGIKQIRDKNNSKVHRMFWIIVFCVSLITVYVYLSSTWANLHKNPFMVTVDSYTYPVKNLDFPAVSLCNFNRISRKALEERVAYYKNSLKLDHNHTNLVREYLQQLGRLIDYRYDHKLQDIMDASPLTLSSQDIRQIMQELAPSCEEMLIKCRWAGREVNCMSIFRLRRTGLGHCCTFNYVFDLNNSTQEPVKRQMAGGGINGLVVGMDSIPEDYGYRVGNGHGFHVLLHDALYYPEFRGGRVQYYIAQPNYFETLQLQAIEQYATDEVHKYSVQTRQCMFREEDKKSFYGLYSFNACLVKCRIEAIKSLCHCIPFFYHIKNEGTDKICTLSDLKCLRKNSKKLLYLYPKGLNDFTGLETEVINSLECPNCLMDCELTYTQSRQYKVALSKRTSSKGMAKGHSFLPRINLTNKCVLSISHATAVGMLHRLDVVAYWFEILSNIGGFSGVIMGIGCFTFVEILYYLIIRFPRSIYTHYKKNSLM